MAVRYLQHTAARTRLSKAAPPRAAVSNGATPRAAQPKNKTDREAYNGCCPCGHRDSPVCLCVYIDETMKGHAADGATRRAILWSVIFNIRVCAGQITWAP